MTQLKQEPGNSSAAAAVVQHSADAKPSVKPDPSEQLQTGSVRMDADSTANGAQQEEPELAGQLQPDSARMDADSTANAAQHREPDSALQLQPSNARIAADSTANGAQHGEPDVSGQSRRPKRQRSSVDCNQDHISLALAAEEQRAAKRRAKAVQPALALMTAALMTAAQPMEN